MEKIEKPLEGISNMVTKNFELTNKTMENYLDFFQKNTKNLPWLETDLNSKMKGYIEQNISAASEFTEGLAKAKDFQDLWRIQTEFMQAQWKALTEQTKYFANTAGKDTTRMGPSRTP
jgi:hypothetical protein